MTKIDITKQPFHETTMLKLDIFRKCSRVRDTTMFTD